MRDRNSRWGPMRRATFKERLLWRPSSPFTVFMFALGIAVALTAAVIVLFGLYWMSYKPGPGRVSVPELDARTLTIGRNFVGRSAADVLRAVGEPAQKRGDSEYAEWRYAVRAWSPVRDFQIPAAILRIEFDAAGVVTDWYFRDPHSPTRLPVRENLADARRFLRAICRQPVPEIDLQASLKRRHSTKSDVASLLAPALVSLLAPRPADKGREEDVTAGLAWEYHVDRPSPVFIPPFYVAVLIQDGIVTAVYPSGYGGCGP